MKLIKIKIMILSLFFFIDLFKSRKAKIKKITLNQENIDQELVEFEKFNPEKKNEISIPFLLAKSITGKGKEVKQTNGNLLVTNIFKQFSQDFRKGIIFELIKAGEKSISPIAGTTALYNIKYNIISDIYFADTKIIIKTEKITFHFYINSSKSIKEIKEESAFGEEKIPNSKIKEQALYFVEQANIALDNYHTMVNYKLYSLENEFYASMYNLNFLIKLEEKSKTSKIINIKINFF